ncbi:MAG: hypothetical protein M3362_00025 [Acidobacteriota bacterium]|nr:hypothetical protein [Acidobacteriota bacterium]
MNAIVGESIFFDVSRIITRRNQISFYQYKALESFIEILTLHNHVALFLGDETDTAFINSFEWLIDAVHEKTDCAIELVTAKRRRQYISSETMSLFEGICREIYSHPLGITSDELFKKHRKDRTSEDMSERIEQLFVRDCPKFNCKTFSNGIFEILKTNATASELLYFFRAHLFQAIAELQNLTPFYENERLIAAIIQQRCRQNNRVGALPYAIYRMVNNLFIQTNDLLPESKTAYPKASILMSAIVEKASNRGELFDSIVLLREELKEFRRSYYDAEETLFDEDKSLYERSEVKRLLEESAQQIWMPVIASLGSGYSSNKIGKILKGVFGKYGIGELKLQHEDRANTSESKVTYSTPSFIGIVTALAQTASEVYKDSKLAKPNKQLLDLILRVAKLTETKRKLTALLPVRNFECRLPMLVDSLLGENISEVAQ